MSDDPMIGLDPKPKHKCRVTVAAFAGCLSTLWTAGIWFVAGTALAYVLAWPSPWAFGSLSWIAGMIFAQYVLRPMYRRKLKRGGEVCPDCYTRFDESGAS